jgi:hypothetical protein
MTDHFLFAPKNLVLRWPKGGNWGIFIFLLIIAGIFRFVNLRTNPGWYADEGNFINFAANLAAGKWEMFGLVNAPMLIQRPPLFIYVLSGLFHIFNTDIVVLRALTATYGLLTIPVIYLFVREAFYERLALITVGIMAIWPWIVAYNRIGFTYNQLAFFLALTIYAGWKFSITQKGIWAVFASISAGISICTDFLGAIGPVFIVGLFFLFDHRWIFPSILIILGILSITLFPAYLASPAYFFKDIGGVIQNRGSISLINQLLNLILYYGEFIRRESWIILGLVGIFILPMNRARGMIWFVVGVSLLVTFRTILPVGISLHYLIHLFPFFVIGISVFFDHAFSWVFTEIFTTSQVFFNHMPIVKKWFSNNWGWHKINRIISYGFVFIILIIPIIWMFLLDVSQSFYGSYFIFSGDNNLRLSQAKDVELVNAYLLKEAHSGAIISASSQILWSVPGKKLELPSTLYFQEQYSKSLYPIGKERMTNFRPLQNFSFVILDPLVKELSVRLYPGLDGQIKEVEKWPMVNKSGDIEVYRNPQIGLINN